MVFHVLTTYKNRIVQYQDYRKRFVYSIADIVRATYAGTDLGNCWEAKQRDTTQPCLLPRPDPGTLTPSLPTDATRHW